MRPTAAGAVFVRSARRVLAELRRLDDELDELAGPGGGTVALGAAAGVLPGALARLKVTQPDVRVRLRQGRTEELLPLLAAGELDLVVPRPPARRDPSACHPYADPARRRHAETPATSAAAPLRGVMRFQASRAAILYASASVG